MNPQDNNPVTPVPPTPSPAPELPPLPNEGQLTAAVVQQILSGLGQTTDQVSPFSQVVNAADKKRMAKPRPGVEQQIPLLISLAQRFGVNPIDYTLDEFQTDVAFAVAMGEIQVPIIVLEQMVTDTIFVTRSRYYAALTSIYSALQALATHNPQLVLELDPLSKFFSQKPKKPAKPKQPVTGGTAGSTTAAPPATNAGSASSSGAPSPSAGSSASPALAPAPLVAATARRHYDRRKEARSI